MQVFRSWLPVLALAGSVLTPAVAQSPAEPFAPPVRVQAGKKLAGEQRYYPSPVLHDVNGDGRLDIVVGDLVGNLTVALRTDAGGPPTYAAETALQSADGKALKFHNW
jgi:hypothetical protein